MNLRSGKWFGSAQLALRVGAYAAGAACGAPGDEARAGTVFEVTSPYHHIRVVDQQGVRTLSFDGSTETRMSLQNPLAGHFEYIEYFHLPWLWHTNIQRALMLGLGGGSVQRAYQHYYPAVTIDTVEIDPVVQRVARDYFFLKETPKHRVHISDGRVYVRTHPGPYDVIIMDAYVKNRYGSFIPYHLATREFFRLARDRLSTNGVIAYNVIGSLQGWRADILAAVYRTMSDVFPHVYLFPARETFNVVMIGSRTDQKMSLTDLQRRAALLAQSRRTLPPGFLARLQAFRDQPPPAAARAPLLTDDFAPVDGLLSRVRSP